ncbi:hypothetical protein [Neobacillus mesonae]|uniref:hypothetical protein n=1 Tax=Neobacillus mesonae TaxID=1193713 RepID=UPI002E22942D|nr:hypothetical protein [Neobacillus mesonae]
MELLIFLNQQVKHKRTLLPFNSAASFTAGTTVTDFTHTNGLFEPGVEIRCAPVCVE